VCPASTIDDNFQLDFRLWREEVAYRSDTLALDDTGYKIPVPDGWYNRLMLWIFD
jgi:hypothetical protein